MASLAELNTMSASQAEETLLRSCGSRAWARKMVAARPFENEAKLFSEAERFWGEVSPEDWAEAFGHHPRIGEKALHERFGSTATWATEEQKGAVGASEGTL